MRHIKRRPQGLFFIPISLVIVFLVLFSGNTAYSSSENIILAFGDSITVGEGENNIKEGNGSRTGGYEPDLEVLIEENGPHHDVLNYGLSGEYTMERGDRKGGYRRLRENVLPKHPNAKFVLIMEGTNDYWTGASRSTTVSMLELMVDTCLARGIEPVLATLTPDMTRSWGPRKQIPLYNELIVELAKEKEIKLVDTYTPMVDEWKTRYALADYNDDWYIDYTHLSREGYHKLAELWYEAIKPPPPPLLPWRNLLLTGN